MKTGNPWKAKGRAYKLRSVATDALQKARGRDWDEHASCEASLSGLVIQLRHLGKEARATLHRDLRAAARASGGQMRYQHAGDRMILA